MTKWRVKEVCKEQGITLAVLADRMGVKAPSVTQYLQSDNMSSSTLIKIADVLGVRLDDLVVREGCNINGFVDVNGTTHRIRTKEDIVELLATVECQEKKGVAEK